MHRFYLPPEPLSGPELCLGGREAHHALHVLRLRRGERVMVLDGAGTQITTEVVGADRDELRLRILERVAGPALPCRITLLQAIPKGKLMESIVQKATELGTARIVPVLSERVVRKLDTHQSAHEVSKLQAVAVEAIKQCGCPWLPIIEPPTTIQEFLSRGESFDLPLVASLQERSKHPGDWCREFAAKRGSPPTSICIWIGPEGDFTPNELKAIEDSGALPVTLGPFVLRTITAAIYCVSVVNHEVQLLAKSSPAC